MMERQYSSGISVFDRMAIARPVAIAMPSRPYRISAVSHALACLSPRSTTSVEGERHVSEIASRCPLQRPHMWHAAAPFMLRNGKSGAQLIGYGAIWIALAVYSLEGVWRAKFPARAT